MGSWVCVANQCQWECAQTGEAHLALAAQPMEGDAPLAVQFTATLHLFDDAMNEQYYCADFAWDFGDGEGYAAIPSCIPYEPGMSEIQTTYTAVHTYMKPGTYGAKLVVKGLESDAATVVIPAIDAQYACSTDVDCATAGCSGQLCVNAQHGKDIVTTCEYRSAYDCLKLTSCGCSESVCQFAKTEEYQGCIEEAAMQTGSVGPSL